MNVVHGTGEESQSDLTHSQQHLNTEQENDPHLSPKLHYLHDGQLPSDEDDARRIILESEFFVLLDGLLHHICPIRQRDSPGESPHQLVIPASMQQELLEAFHDDLYAGHLGIAKTFHRLRQRYYWRSLYSDVVAYCNQCVKCATRKNPSKKTRYPLQPLPVDGPFDRIAVDYLGPLPQTEKGNRYLLVFSDYLTKWPEVFPTADQTAETVARLLTEQVICRHSAPRQLLSDRGTNFLSKLVKEICRMCDTRKLNTTSYHPQTDGLVERFNRTLLDMLAKMVDADQKNWDTHLPFCLFAYRTARQASTEQSPFALLYGRPPRLPIDSELLVAIRPYCELDDYAVQAARHFSTARTYAHECIQRAQQNQTKAYNKSMTAIQFATNDTVLLCTPQVSKGKTKKLSHLWSGPYIVKSTNGNNVFIQKESQPHSQFLRVHANRLKKFTPAIPTPVLPDRSKQAF
ncbi:MAG: DDE-type integrase/transposase/recombinase, partial [Pseudomonadota bacterium]